MSAQSFCQAMVADFARASTWAVFPPWAMAHVKKDSTESTLLQKDDRVENFAPAPSVGLEAFACTRYSRHCMVWFLEAALKLP